MGYVEQRLRSGEQVVVKARGHWLPNLASYLILAAFSACLLPVSVSGIGLLFDESIIQLVCCGFWLIIIVALVAQGLAIYLSTEFALTTDNRIIAKKGMIKRHLLELDQGDLPLCGKLLQRSHERPGHRSHQGR